MSSIIVSFIPYVAKLILKSRMTKLGWHWKNREYLMKLQLYKPLNSNENQNSLSLICFLVKTCWKTSSYSFKVFSISKYSNTWYFNIFSSSPVDSFSKCFPQNQNFLPPAVKYLFFPITTSFPFGCCLIDFSVRCFPNLIYGRYMYNHGHNILKPFDIWPNFLCTTSETKRDY